MSEEKDLRYCLIIGGGPVGLWPLFTPVYGMTVNIIESLSELGGTFSIREKKIYDSSFSAKRQVRN